MEMEMQEEIVIIGAGMSGLATALGLHRLGLRSLVLERAEDLRSAGYAFTTWHNLWKSLDVLGIGDTLRQQPPQLQSLEYISSKDSSVEVLAVLSNGGRSHEFRCIRRKLLLETIANELPKNTIRFESKVVSIEESDRYTKLLVLADGSTIKAKVVIGCDGVGSVVAKWLGLSKPLQTGRCAIRGFVDYKTSHGFEPKMTMIDGEEVKYGIVPIDETTLYWFMTIMSSTCQDKEVTQNPEKMKQHVLSKVGEHTYFVKQVIDKTKTEDMICFPLTYKNPLEVLWGNIVQDNVCVAGDAFHSMTPDLGQGACSSIEDGIVLARCIGRALLVERDDRDEDEYYFRRIKMGLEKYAKERRWRVCGLIVTSLVVGFIEQGYGVICKFLRGKGYLSAYMLGLRFKRGEFDPGDLN